MYWLSIVPSLSSPITVLPPLEFKNILLLMFASHLPATTIGWSPDKTFFLKFKVPVESATEPITPQPTLTKWFSAVITQSVIANSFILAGTMMKSLAAVSNVIFENETEPTEYASLVGSIGSPIRKPPWSPVTITPSRLSPTKLIELPIIHGKVISYSPLQRNTDPPSGTNIFMKIFSKLVGLS